MSKMKIAVPTGASVKDTGTTAGGAVIGFLGGRFINNQFPKIRTKQGQALILLAALGLHAAIGGSDTVAKISQGAALGLGLNSAGELANQIGMEMPEPAEQANGALRGATDVLKKALCSYRPSSPGMGFPVSFESTAALNAPGNAWVEPTTVDVQALS